jgi:hypothetical protein
MLSYLQKFNNLPVAIKNAVASPEATARIAALGKQYNLELASVVMKVVTKEIKLDGLGAFLINQLGIPAETSRSLEKDLRKIVFAPVIDFLLSPDANAKLVFDQSDEHEVKTIAKDLTSFDYDAQVDEALELMTAVTQFAQSIKDAFSYPVYRLVKTAAQIAIEKEEREAGHVVDRVKTFVALNRSKMRVGQERELDLESDDVFKGLPKASWEVEMADNKRYKFEKTGTHAAYLTRLS